MKAELGDLVLWTTIKGGLYFGKVYGFMNGAPWVYDYSRKNKHAIGCDYLVIAGTRIVDGKATGVEDDKIIDAMNTWEDSK